MGSDSCFRIGSSHAFCQDYAIAGALQRDPSYPGFPYAILSDGCSGGVAGDDKPTAPPPPKEPGAPFTDFGSRFLVRAAQLRLPEFLFDYGGTYDPRLLIRDAAEMATKCRFRAPALDATLLVAFQDGKDVRVFQSGDGVVAARHRRTQQISYTTLHFANNAPFYLSYILSPVNMAKYLVKCESVTVVEGYQDDKGAWTEKTEEVLMTTTSSPVRSYRFGPEYDLVMVMSDGAESFQTFDNTIVPLTTILEQLFAIKNPEGEFITRRCNRFLGAVCREKGWKHTDDLSVGGIYVPAGTDT